jgi:hypothetical protein
VTNNLKIQYFNYNHKIIQLLLSLELTLQSMEAFVLVHVDMRGENDYQQKINRGAIFMIYLLTQHYGHNNVFIFFSLLFF